jgi:hypothetical protein
MSKIDQLIAVFKEVKEDLNKVAGLKDHESIGHVGFGNNQDHEIMRHKKTGAISLLSHQDNKLVPHHEFMHSLKTHQPHHVKGAADQINHHIKAAAPLNKNVNNSYAGAPNATTGTSGGQGGMYRSENMNKQMISASPGGAQDMSMIKAHKNGQWHIDKMDEPHKDDPNHEKKEVKIAKDIKAKAKKLEGMHKTDELADDIIEKLEKACGMKKEDSYISKEGKNREANPKLRASDLGPGGKVHMIKEEDAEKCDGTNSEAATSKPHNKGKFKVMPMEPEKSVKHLDAKGLPYDGKDKDVKKGEECSECHHDPCTCAKKSQMGHIQGNDAKGNDENKAPGRGTLSV